MVELIFYIVHHKMLNVGRHHMSYLVVVLAPRSHATRDKPTVCERGCNRKSTKSYSAKVWGLFPGRVSGQPVSSSCLLEASRVEMQLVLCNFSLFIHTSMGNMAALVSIQMQLCSECLV
jgi:hypothetical protein